MELVLGIILIFSYVFAFDNSDKFINEINNKQNFWKAGRNFPVDTPQSRLRGLFGAKILPTNESKQVPVKANEIDDYIEVPLSFDSRTKWSKCGSIKEIADQASCASCWAVSVATAIQDRVCIHSDGELQPQISARNLLSCEKLSAGCNGGFSINAWLYWKQYGLVTGGPYGSNVGCQPYPFAPCEHFVTGSKPDCARKQQVAPKCVKTCDNVTINYKNDLTFGKDAYFLPDNETKIQIDIMENGPVVATFYAFQDFLHYKSGIYVKTSDIFAGLHDVRIIGWGEENGTKYWLVANSWNEDWGDKGLFKIRRGTNECKIEAKVCAALPKL